MAEEERGRRSPKRTHTVTHNPAHLPSPTQAEIKGKTEEQEAKDQAAKGRVYAGGEPPAEQEEEDTPKRRRSKKSEPTE